MHVSDWENAMNYFPTQCLHLWRGWTHHSSLSANEQGLTRRSETEARRSIGKRMPETGNISSNLNCTYHQTEKFCSIAALLYERMYHFFPFAFLGASHQVNVCCVTRNCSSHWLLALYVDAIHGRGTIWCFHRDVIESHDETERARGDDQCFSFDHLLRFSNERPSAETACPGTSYFWNTYAWGLPLIVWY